MKFALVDGQRCEAQSRLIGRCLGCDQELIAKCGKVRVNHWAHKGGVHCDLWQSKETDWHRNWKNQFPIEWQEVLHKDNKSGEFHFADVKTKSGWVIEFQHSPISSIEKKSREEFYPNLIWVVDGSRRVNDTKNFFKILGNLNWKLSQLKSCVDVEITLPEGNLLHEWLDSKSHVFYDFGNNDLWWLHSDSSRNIAYLITIKKTDFLEMHRNEDCEMKDAFSDLIKKYKVMLATIRKSLPDERPQWMSIQFERHQDDVIKKIRWINRRKALKKN